MRNVHFHFFKLHLFFFALGYTVRKYGVERF